MQSLLLVCGAQSVSFALAVCSLVETLPWYYYREYYYRDEAMGEADKEPVSATLIVFMMNDKSMPFQSDE